MKQYYDARAAEYDDWWLGEGLHATRHRPGWHAAAAELCAAVAALPPRRTLDVACGTGFLTQHLRGEVVVVDSALHEDVVPERTEERILKDGSRWEVYKRYFRAGELAAELGGGEVLFSDRWFVMVRA